MNFKKITVLVLTVLLTFCLTTGVAFAAVAEFSSENTTPKSILLIDADSGFVMYSKSPDEPIYPASTTKIITSLVVLEQVSDLSEKVTIGSEVNAFGDKDSLVTPRLVENEVMTVEDLMYGMLLCSGNDAAQALAVHVSGTTDEFVKLMTAKAAELGMTSTTFVTVFGRDARQYEETPEKNETPNLTTANDMAKAMRAAVENEKLMKICGTATHTIAATNKTAERTLTNTNRLIATGTNESNSQYLYSNATGIKTGSTPKAFKCLAASATKDGMNLIALIYGDQTDDGNVRWVLAKELFEYGFKNYKTINLKESIESIPLTVPVKDSAEAAEGAEASLTLRHEPLENDAYYTAPIGDEGSEVTATLSVTSISAPVIEGDEIGTVTYRCGETELATLKVTAAASMAKFGQELPTESKAPGEGEHSGLVWLWLLIPAAAIVFLIVRTFMKQNKKFTRRKRM